MPAQPAEGDHAAKAGRPRRESSPYMRQGTAYLLVAFEPGTGQRRVKVPARRTGADYGCRLLRLAAHYPQAAKIVLVRDTLPTHPDAGFYQHLRAPLKGWGSQVKRPSAGIWLALVSSR